MDESQPLSTSGFLQHPEVLQCLKELEELQAKKPLIVSDVLDENGNQYVHLVQKGGGMLGIALVGYTYILEKMGIRFMRLAGTSAGAINTAMCVAIDNKEDAKSEKILKVICELDFFKLVDGHPAARWIIRNFITNDKFMKKIKLWLGIFFGFFGFFIAADIVLLGLEKHDPQLYRFTISSFVITGFFLVLISVSGYYFYSLIQRLKNAGFGINPGDYFYDWIKERLAENGITNVTELNKKANMKVPGLKLRVDHPSGIDQLEGDVTFITSELVTENKIEFPKMCDLFKPAAKIDTLQPAGFIRASMSIPVFFESYFINNIDINNQEVKDAWKHRLGVDKPPVSARFVDGGILSNFPINIFYNPNIMIPRLPSFGIDLDDSSPDEKDTDAESWSFGGYFGKMFNTIRDYYDKDFLLKNRVYEKGIGKIPLSEYNWLNFFMTDEDKINMFVRGARTATDFLKKFDWEAYKQNRSDMQKTINSSHAMHYETSLNPNTGHAL